MQQTASHRSTRPLALVFAFCFGAAFACLFSLVWLGPWDPVPALDPRNLLQFQDKGVVIPTYIDELREGRDPTLRPRNEFPINSRVYFPRYLGFIETLPEMCAASGPHHNTRLRGVRWPVRDGGDWGGVEPVVINMVMSATTHTERRYRMRRFTPPPPGMRRVFVVGIPVLDSHAMTFCSPETAAVSVEVNHTDCVVDDTTLNSLKYESAIFGDVVIGDFLDVYQNLTWKTLTMMHWKVNFCPQAPILLKQDDDTFVNYDNFLFQIATKFGNITLADLPPGEPDAKNATRAAVNAAIRRIGHVPRMFGKIFTVGTAPMRRPTWRNRVNEKAFPANHFAHYASGPAYAATDAAAREIIKISRRLEWLHIEDVWTGIAGYHSDIKMVQLPDVYEEEKKRKNGTVDETDIIHKCGTIWKNIPDSDLVLKTLSTEAAQCPQLVLPPARNATKIEKAKKSEKPKKI